MVSDSEAGTSNVNQQCWFKWKVTRAETVISGFPQHKGCQLCYSSCEKHVNNSNKFIIYRSTT